MKRSEPGGADTESQKTTFSSNLLEVRLAAGMSQRALARRAGLAPSSISKIENVQVSPTYDVMLRLSEALDVDLARLLHEAPGGASAPEATARLVVERKSEQTRHPAGHYDYTPLTMALVRRIMDPTLIHVRETSIDAFDDWIRHPGEEFALVLSGCVVLHTEHYAPVTLTQGDAVHYDASMGHLFTSPTPVATILNITAHADDKAQRWR
ncbi:MAG: transcriptional regulator, XRE family with cupin sensor [Rhodobacteraceae bacterium HLUCCA12]|nr:MAG: transcriptional regulator, XRE family with cupin sensor [Rhodobacteraceae bacterium HLUCCA12]